MAGGDPVGKERKVAIHGKGGIGKSTVSPNLPATLSGADLRMRQIGRDRKSGFLNYLRGGALFPQYHCEPNEPYFGDRGLIAPVPHGRHDRDRYSEIR